MLKALILLPVVALAIANHASADANDVSQKLNLLGIGPKAIIVYERCKKLSCWDETLNGQKDFFFGQRYFKYKKTTEPVRLALDLDVDQENSNILSGEIRIEANGGCAAVRRRAQFYNGTLYMQVCEMNEWDCGYRELGTLIQRYDDNWVIVFGLGANSVKRIPSYKMNAFGKPGLENGCWYNLDHATFSPRQ
jgi:hypothetical protein